ncbi:hypothetical protein [uncultured Tateyamaria sp.]|uniref:hypothetical protein n=1 Tax=uncultured Tateyamaria sp. TaxID=455651 RepID=UPI00262A469E|nr:hypothetical protein [uncultured Tateyamaria sp.]
MTQESKRHGRTLGIALVAILLWGVAALWSWNTFAVELLGLPEMAYRHALALGTLVLSVGGLLAMPLWMSRAGNA